jgi:hypothetical protein
VNAGPPEDVPFNVVRLDPRNPNLVYACIPGFAELRLNTPNSKGRDVRKRRSVSATPEPHQHELMAIAWRMEYCHQRSSNQSGGAST